MSDVDSNKPSFLRLVVGAAKSREETPDNEKFGDSATQMEMFGNANSICFASVRDLAFDEFKALIDRFHVHHVIDLREAPYLNFGRSSRDSFFRFFAERSVEYVSLTAIAATKNKPSVDELLKNEEQNPRHELGDKLSTWISNGPTLVLISKEREEDNRARSFSKFLSQSKISYSEISCHVTRR